MRRAPTEKQIDKAEVLEPGLLSADKVVLAAVSECGPNEWARREPDMAVTIWQIAEVLNTQDLADLGRTLNGLQHLEYVCSADSRARKRRVYWRTRKGDEVLVRAVPARGGGAVELPSMSS